MQIFLSAFEDPRSACEQRVRHDLGELLVIAFVSVLCGSSLCGDGKERLFRDFLKLKHAFPRIDTFIFRMIDPKPRPSERSSLTWRHC